MKKQQAHQEREERVKREEEERKRQEQERVEEEKRKVRCFPPVLCPRLVAWLVSWNLELQQRVGCCCRLSALFYCWEWAATRELLDSKQGVRSLLTRCCSFGLCFAYFPGHDGEGIPPSRAKGADTTEEASPQQHCPSTDPAVLLSSRLPLHFRSLGSHLKNVWLSLQQ